MLTWGKADGLGQTHVGTAALGRPGAMKSRPH